jgi:hypothetical protein
VEAVVIEEPGASKFSTTHADSRRLLSIVAVLLLMRPTVTASFSRELLSAVSNRRILGLVGLETRAVQDVLHLLTRIHAVHRERKKTSATTIPSSNRFLMAQEEKDKEDGYKIINF